tara:strand:- start:962 stop:1141 length:180 start_codon:yes stop_codon:yes gene_type:complete
MERENQILTISNILNNTKVWDKISEALDIEMDSNSMIFHEIEEFILDKLDEMTEDNQLN